ncbi:MAG: neutral/alkaline non-lysosomal ceramidase N-terminal domain-containing protein [Isosphaeraceae bacterium]
MNESAPKRRQRRDFLISAAGTAAGLAVGSPGYALDGGGIGKLRVGEGVADITPPLGIEMGGFHRPPGQERRIKSIRQKAAVRVLVAQVDAVQVAICSLDVAAISQDMAARVQNAVSRQTGIPAAHVRLCATHTHSMPGFCFLRQWGALPREFMVLVEKRTAEAVCKAKDDLAPAELALGKCRVTGGNHNRIVKTARTDDQFTPRSTDLESWLDTMLHALLFHRAGKRTLLWYHFSAHGVCFADEAAGPDWPGMVAERARHNEKLEPSFLQGHCGDVNPGDGSDWRGQADQTVGAIYPALQQAINSATPIRVNRLDTLRTTFRVPFDIALMQRWLEQYRREPAKCVRGPWVDAGFAADWYQGNAGRDLSQKALPSTLSAVRLGEVGLLFHPGELFSFYGLAIRRDSPFRDTLTVGYTDGCVGYLCDPKAYQSGAYEAFTVPKILDYPPFTPTAARQMTSAAIGMLKRVAT